MVNTATHTMALMQRVEYPLPARAASISSQRGGASSTRAAGYGAFGGPPYTRRSNDGLVLVVMV
ncbi:MAG: hypothetical protein H7274_21325 [Rhodoferax sp.]|nr:hypothetical protein [Rhodoferax sp.]